MVKKEMFGEEIQLLTEMLKLLWLTPISLTGSVQGLVLGEFGFRKIAIAMGSFAIMAVAGLIAYLHRRIFSRVRNLEEV